MHNPSAVAMYRVTSSVESRKLDLTVKMIIPWSKNEGLLRLFACRKLLSVPQQRSAVVVSQRSKETHTKYMFMFTEDNFQIFLTNVVALYFFSGGTGNCFHIMDVLGGKGGGVSGAS